MAAGPGNGDGDVGPVARVDEHQAVERVRIKVNGVEIEVKRKVEVREIIVKAKKADAIEGFVEEYVIERVAASYPERSGLGVHAQPPK